jgi:D-amino-acid oxidase
MSCGCAYEVVDIIAGQGFAEGEKIAVLGGGVMGLTAAALLKERGYDVAVYATAFPPCTTSDVAGGQWAPASVHQVHQSKGAAFGVSPRPNYATTTLPSFADVPNSIIPPPEKLAHLPFARLTSPGYKYNTLLVEPPIFLPRLIADLKQANVERKHKTFASMTQVLSDSQLPQRVIVNCTGLGAKILCGDTKVHPVKGQFVILPAQPQLQYLFCSSGYLFPRQDAVVVGGSEENHFTDDKPDLNRCRMILNAVRRAFEPTLFSKMMPNFLAANISLLRTGLFRISSARANIGTDRRARAATIPSCLNKDPHKRCDGGGADAPRLCFTSELPLHRPARRFSPTCPPNGRGSTGFSAFLRSSFVFERVSFFPGKRNFAARDKGAKWPLDSYLEDH